MVHLKMMTGVIMGVFLLTGTCNKPNPVDGTKPDPKPSFGSFQISVVAPEGTSPGYASIVGRVNDGPSPSTIVWEEKATIGSSKLLVPRIPFCSEPCGGNAACVEDDSCQPYPLAIYVGKVTVNGMAAKDGQTSFTMDSSRGNYQPTGILFAYPPFSEGGIVTVSAAGSPTCPAFTLSGRGISPLEVQSDSIVLEDNKPITLRWTPPGIADNTTISIMVDISHHGGTKGKIVCECADNGSVTIPATLLDQLKALGYFGFPKIEISRRAITRDTVANVDLIFECKITKYVQIPGLKSCNGDEDCNAGQTCEYFRCH